ncbi:hypothetical protein KBT16_25720 [Nostoc sp. CCCryo 231-06]|nr:hypothetical protein [Nostoc sp. CCCryo 231-06]
MGLILRETPSSLSPSANSVGNGRNPQDFGCNTVIIGVSLIDLRFEILVIATQSKIQNRSTERSRSPKSQIDRPASHC